MRRFRDEGHHLLPLTISNPNGNWNGSVSTINAPAFGGLGTWAVVRRFTLNGNLAKTGSGTITCNAARAVGGNVTVSSGVLYAQYNQCGWNDDYQRHGHASTWQPKQRHGNIHR